MLSVCHCSYAWHNLMKIQSIICAVVISAATLISNKVSAQEESEKMTRAEFRKMDSLKLADEQLQVNKSKDARSMSDLRSEKRNAKAKAKEADQVKRNADDAVKQSSDAYKSERKAQKSRRKADTQAKKAQKSREKSDRN
jgi:hypothetical protein